MTLTSISAGSISNDHIDLLVTAASRYGVLSNPTTAAFSVARARAGVVATATDAGRLLLEHYRAAQRSHVASAGMLDVDETPYAYTPVDRFEPVEVAKATHCYEHAVRGSALWPCSSAQRLVEHLIRAATRRLPGYLEATWEWTPQPGPLGPPAGLCRSWRPVEQGVRWVGAGELAEVYLCTDDRIDKTSWALLDVLPSLPDAVIMLPPGFEWLQEQLRHPACAYRRSAIYPSPSIPVG